MLNTQVLAVISSSIVAWWKILQVVKTCQHIDLGYQKNYRVGKILTHNIAL